MPYRKRMRKGSPSKEQVHYDSVLTTISTAFIQEQTNYIASKVFKIVPVDKQSNKYPVYDQNDWFQDDAQIRGDAEESAGSGFTISKDSYDCDVWAHHKDIGAQLSANADSTYDLDADASRFVTAKLLLRMENQWVSDYFKTNVWGTDLVGGAGFTLFSDYSGSAPVQVVSKAQETVLQNTGFEPNALVMGVQVYNYLKQHPDFVDRIKYTNPDAVNAAIMARLFEVENVYVAKAIKATNTKGQDPTYDFAFGKNMLLCYVPPRPALLTPAAGYTFSWNYAPVGTGNIAINRLDMPLKKAVRIEGEAAWDNKVVGKNLGYFFSGAVA